MEKFDYKKTVCLFFCLTVIAGLVFHGCTSFKSGILGHDSLDYFPPDIESGRLCTDRAYDEKENCLQIAESRKYQCEDRERSVGESRYRRAVDRYEQQLLACENRYQQALRRWEYEIAQGQNVRRPDRWVFCGQIFEPTREQYIDDEKCERDYRSNYNRCWKNYYNTFVNKCGGRAE